MNRSTDRLLDLQKQDRGTQTNGQIDNSVCRAGKERQGQTAMETEASSCLELSLLAFFFSEDIDEQTPCSKKPSGPMGLPKPLLLGTPKYKLYMNS